MLKSSLATLLEGMIMKTKTYETELKFLLKIVKNANRYVLTNLVKMP